MQVNSITKFNYGMSTNSMTNPNTQKMQQKPVQNEGLTASIYFGSKDNQGANAMRKATMAFVVPMIMAPAISSGLSGCTKDETFAKSESSSYSSSSTSDTTIVKVNTHAKGCCCHSCKDGKDTVYVNVPGPTEYIYLPGDTVKLPGDTVYQTDTIHHTDTVHHHDTTYVEVPKEIPIVVYVDTGSYHVVHDTITKWKDDYQKPIPLDTLSKWGDKFDVDGMTPGRKNIVSYQGIREWEYGERFTTMMDQLQSNRTRLVYKREDLDWEGNHTGWGYDVFRMPPQNGFKIKTYNGKTITNPSGIFVETYKDPFNSEKSKVDDNDLITRQFFQTNGKGDIVKVYSFDRETGLYREDGSISKGYLDKNTKGSNILLTDLIASDPDKKFSTDPNYSTEDHLVACKVVTVNDEELKLLYVRAKDDEIAEQLYGSVDSNSTRGAIADPWGVYNNK